VDIRFFDQDGQNLGKSKERSVENVFFREDFRRVSFDDLGNIEEIGGVSERHYIQAFLKALNVKAIKEAHFNLVVDYASAPTSLVLPLILNELGCTVVALNERIDQTKMSMATDVFDRGLDQLALITATVKADFGVRLDVGGERLWLVDGKGVKLSGTQTAGAFMELALRSLPAADKPPVIAVMVNQPNLFEALAERHHAQVRRTKIDAQALMDATEDSQTVLAMSGAGEFIVPSFHRLIDAIFPVGKLLEYLALQKTTLDEVVNSLPVYYTARKRMGCPWDQKGTVMRLLNEQYKGQILDQLDGIKLQVTPSEWVLIVPEADEAVFTLYSQGSTEEAASGLVDRYARVIDGMRS
jgi:mannose-1-phosphate guanylyltransferase/phosphomannomutase